MALTRASAGEARQILRSSATAPNPLVGNCCRRRLGLPLCSSTSSSPSPSLLVCRAGLKLTESFDASLPLDDEKREALFSRLSDPNFCAQVSLETTQATKVVKKNPFFCSLFSRFLFLEKKN